MKNLQQYALILLLSVITASAIAQTRAISDFNSVRASGSVNVKLVKADKPSIAYKMIAGNEKNLITEVKDNILTVRIKKNRMFGNSKTNAEVTVYYTSINDVSSSAGSTVSNKEAIESSSFEVDASSGSSVTLYVESNEIDIDASSGSRIQIKGKANEATFDASSGSSIDAGKLECNKADADVSSGANMTIFVNKELTADASSGGSIKYKGDVEYFDADASSSGQVKRIK